MRIDDFRSITASLALKRRTDGAIIVARDSESGRLEEWMFDFRAVVLNPDWIGAYADIFWEMNSAKYPFQIGGMETGGIPLVAAIVMKGIERGTPVNGFYIRKSRKRDGLMKIVEGTLTNDPIILVDDLIHSGQTLHKQILTLQTMGLTVREIFVVVSYRDIATYAFASDRAICVRSLFTLEDFGIPLVPTRERDIPKRSFDIVWQFRAPEPSHFLVVSKSIPALDAQHFYMGFDDGVFRTFDKKTGAPVWTYRIGKHPAGKGILSSPALFEEYVYFGAYDGNVYALSTITGEKIWQFDEADWVGSSPYIDSRAGCLYIGLEFGLFKKRGGVAALDLYTGKKIWEYRTQEFTHASPLHIPQERLVICGSNDGVVTALNEATGAPCWQYATRGHIKSACAYDAASGTVIAVSMDGNVCGLSVRDGSVRFAVETGAGIYGTPLVYDTTAYVASLDKSLYALDLDSGKTKWSFATGGRVFASPSYFDGSIWIGSNDGVVYELNPVNGDIRSSFQTPEKVVSKIVFDESTGYIYVTTHANDVYCLSRSAGGI